jgi:hypothetical protein
LMMDTDRVFETVNPNPMSTWLTAQEDFIKNIFHQQSRSWFISTIIRSS